jgi:hypothetical protein
MAATSLKNRERYYFNCLPARHFKKMGIKKAVPGIFP